MKAVVVNAFGSPEALDKIGEFPSPSAGDDEIIIDIHAAGLNFADLLVVEGKYQSLPELPFVPGKELAGEVASVGPGVSRLKVGDRVLAFVESGGFAERTMAAEQDCHFIPDDMTFREAVSLGLNFQTSHFALVDRAGLKPGETVLVTGASGGVGLAGVQIAKALGATVLAGIANPDKEALVKAAGADHVIDLSVDDLKSALRDQVYAVAGGNGVDVILDPVGGDVFDAGLRALAWRGRIVVIGFVAGRIPEVAANYLLLKNISAVGMYLDSYRKREPEWVARVQAEIYGMWKTGSLKAPEVDAYPLEAFAEAAGALAGRRAKGRILLTPKE
jgi:NADPH2:quinone reductase